MLLDFIVFIQFLQPLCFCLYRESQKMSFLVNLIK